MDSLKEKKFKSRPSGDFDDIKPFFDESKGDYMLDITNLEQWEEPKLDYKPETYRDSRKTVQVGMLFGSNKPSGTLLTKKDVKKPRFSANRVFGHSKAATANN